MLQGLANVFFPFPSPAEKRVKERVGALARERQSGNTLLIHLGWGGLLPIRATFEKPCPLPLASLTRFISCASDPWLITCKVSGGRCPLFFLPPFSQDSTQAGRPHAPKGNSDFGR